MRAKKVDLKEVKNKMLVTRAWKGMGEEWIEREQLMGLGVQSDMRKTL
jgi:hypothetical protein